jgi:hypothetical protein
MKYKSQFVETSVSMSAVNSDCVFWERATSSLLYEAEISVSSGKGEYLNDFKLADSDDILIEKDSLCHHCGVWVPDKSDDEKRISISFENPKDIQILRFYDNVALSDNILNLQIVFDSGTVINTGKLSANGSAVEIQVDEKAVTKFDLILTDYEGQYAGLAEIEAFSSDPSNKNDTGYIKILDSEDNLTYRYTYHSNQDQEFCLYSYGQNIACNADSLKISIDNSDCSATFVENQLVVSCPDNTICTVKVETKDGKYSDVIMVENSDKCNVQMRKAALIDYYSNILSLQKQKEYLLRLYEGTMEIINHLI